MMLELTYDIGINGSTAKAGWGDRRITKWSEKWLCKLRQLKKWKDLGPYQIRKDQMSLILIKVFIVIWIKSVNTVKVREDILLKTVLQRTNNFLCGFKGCFSRVWRSLPPKDSKKTEKADPGSEDRVQLKYCDYN